MTTRCRFCSFSATRVDLFFSRLVLDLIFHSECICLLLVVSRTLYIQFSVNCKCNIYFSYERFSSILNAQVPLMSNAFLKRMLVL